MESLLVVWKETLLVCILLVVLAVSKLVESTVVSAAVETRTIFELPIPFLANLTADRHLCFASAFLVKSDVL